MVYKDDIFKIAMILCIGFGGLGIIIVFANQGTSGKPNPIWIFGAGIMIFGTFVLPVINFINMKSASIYKRAINVLAGLIAASYCFTCMAVIPFLDMPMNIFLRIIGLAFSVGGNIGWCVLFAAACKKVYGNPEFSKNIYIDNGSYFSYSKYYAVDKMFKKIKFDMWLPVWLCVPVVFFPVTFIMQKLLTPLIGSSGYNIFVGFIATPISIMFNGAFIIKPFCECIYYPWKLTHQTGKPVYYAGYLDNPDKYFPEKKANMSDKRK